MAQLRFLRVTRLPIYYKVKGKFQNMSIFDPASISRHQRILPPKMP